MTTVAAAYENHDEASTHNAWADDFAAALRQGPPGAYIGFLGDNGPASVREAYPGGTWERLTAVKARYDPGNLFRLNQNVPPSGSLTS
jgi:FAD/FMN-containing dehydrogenase